MCELFAVSSAHPARVRLRFAAFAGHGASVAGGNPDGWGAAYFDGPDAHVLREPIPAVRSSFVPVALANTQPFSRELAGRRHVFAHNGDLPDIQRRWPLEPGCWQPVGQTDSEHVFCQLLRSLAPLWREPGVVPSVQARLDVVAAFAARLRPVGPVNFLYADGDALFAHAHRRHQADGTLRPPGLHLLLREPALAHAVRAEGLQVDSGNARSHPLAMLASVPLGKGAWKPLPEGCLLVLRDGEVAGTA
jgi:glutamine amidotransferase